MYKLMRESEEFRHLRDILDGIIEGMKLDPIVQAKCIQLK